MTEARKWQAVVLAIVVAGMLGFLYIGTTHQDRCRKAGDVGCSILPWSGEPYVAPPGPVDYSNARAVP